MVCTPRVTRRCWPACWPRDARGYVAVSTSTSRSPVNQTRLWSPWWTSKFSLGGSRDRNRPRDMSDDLKRAARRWAAPADQWRTRVQRWVDAGIVSSEQGEEILALESIETASTRSAH